MSFMAVVLSPFSLIKPIDLNYSVYVGGIFCKTQIQA